MGHITVNFDEVPDKIEPLAPGVYIMRVEEASVEPTADGKGEKVKVVMKVDDDSNPSHGRVMYDHISLKFPVSLKQLCKSAGMSLGKGGIDTADLVGKVVRVRVKTRTYKDKETGEVKETSAVAEYLFD